MGTLGKKEGEEGGDRKRLLVANPGSRGFGGAGLMLTWQGEESSGSMRWQQQVCLEIPH